MENGRDVYPEELKDYWKGKIPDCLSIVHVTDLGPGLGYCGFVVVGEGVLDGEVETDNVEEAQQRPFRMTFKTDEDEVTQSPADGAPPNSAPTNELNRVPGGIVGFNLRWTLQACT